MPLALNRLLTCPAALRVLLVQSCRTGSPYRSYSVPAKLQENAAPKRRDGSEGSRVPLYSLLDQWSILNSEELVRLSELHIAATSPEKRKSDRTLKLLFYDMRDETTRVGRWLGVVTNSGVDIPTSDTVDAGILWGTLLKHKRLVHNVIKYAASIQGRGGGVYPHLYEKCIAYWLRREPLMAAEFHRFMVRRLQLGELPLRRIVEAVRSTLSDDALAALWQIYGDSKQRDIYDAIVPELCNQGRDARARQWHIACLKRGDLPSPAVMSHPGVESLMKTFPLSTRQQSMLLESVLPPVHARRKQEPEYNEQLVQRLKPRAAASVRFDDAFAAKLFATKAFSITNIISGLVLAGVNEIGPQAVRQMGLRAESISDLSHHFSELKEAGIALEGRVFSLALEKFAVEGDHALARSILESDQHPDVFDDVEQQMKLLQYYIAQKDYGQAHRTLAILSLFHNDPATASWNIYLIEAIRAYQERSVADALQTMGSHGIPVAPETLRVLRGVLRPRRRGHRPVSMHRNDFDDLRFVLRFYMMTMQYGIGKIRPVAWRELILRLGKQYRLRELRRLFYWLVSMYKPLPGNLQSNRLRDSVISQNPTDYGRQFPDALEEIFPKSLQQGLIVWGFRAGLLPHAPLERSLLRSPFDKLRYRLRLVWSGGVQRLHWSVGLEMLAQLRDNGLHVKDAMVRKTLTQIFRNLFGPGRSNIKENRVIGEVNQEPLDAYIRKVNEVWGSPLFPELLIGALADGQVAPDGSTRGPGLRHTGLCMAQSVKTGARCRTRACHATIGRDPGVINRCRHHAHVYRDFNEPPDGGSVPGTGGQPKQELNEVGGNGRCVASEQVEGDTPDVRAGRVEGNGAARRHLSIKRVVSRMS